MFDDDVVFFEKAKDDVQVARWVKAQVDGIKKLAKDIDDFERRLLDAIISDATDDDAQLDLPEMDKQARREKALENMNNVVMNVLRHLYEATKVPDFAEIRRQEELEAIKKDLADSGVTVSEKSWGLAK